MNNPHKNWNCSNDKCTDPKGEVRLYPYGGGANGIYCHACWAHENRYRYERQVEYVRKAQSDCRLPIGNARDAVREQAQKQAAKDWPQLDWATAEVYLPAQE